MQQTRTCVAGCLLFVASAGAVVSTAGPLSAAQEAPAEQARAAEQETPADQERPPIIDVHLHALPAAAMGPPPMATCAPFDEFPTWDQRQPYGATFMGVSKQPTCENPIWSPETDEEVMRQTIEVMERRNIVGVLSGSPELVAKWREEAPERFIPGLGFNVAGDEAPTPDGRVTPDSLRRLIESGAVEVLAEITNQYSGIAPDDERMEPYWALAEELDIPVGIHIGTGPPGAPHLAFPDYRASLHSALTLEPVLARHPRLRVYVMHAGFPMIDDMLAVLYAHPQVHVGVGVIAYTQPRAAFHRYLQQIVEAGFGKRVMFGSDQMVWPGAIEPALAAIEEAEFLTEEQKRDILYGNAARFLRLDEEDAESGVSGG